MKEDQSERLLRYGYSSLLQEQQQETGKRGGGGLYFVVMRGSSVVPATFGHSLFAAYGREGAKHCYSALCDVRHSTVQILSQLSNGMGDDWIIALTIFAR